jgi:hypothetical protein
MAKDFSQKWFGDAAFTETPEVVASETPAENGR